MPNPLGILPFVAVEIFSFFTVPIRSIILVIWQLREHHISIGMFRPEFADALSPAIPRYTWIADLFDRRRHRQGITKSLRPDPMKRQLRQIGAARERGILFKKPFAAYCVFRAGIQQDRTGRLSVIAYPHRE